MPARRSRLRLAALAAGLAALAGCASPAAGTPSGTSATPSAPVSSAPSGSRPHVLVIMEENDGYSLTLGDCGSASPDPYLCSLAAGYASVTNWYAIEHPSLPNYLDIISGADQGCTSDGCLGPFSGANLGSQLTSAGIPWVAYMESMPSPCFTGVSSGEYARKHDAFIDFTAVQHAADCSQLVRPYPDAGGIAAALDSPAAPDFVWITPNLMDDMHDGTVQEADAWLRANLTPILASSWFAQDGTVVVTMDENSAQSSGSCCGDAAGGRIPQVVVSAASQGRGQVALTGDHFGTLRTIEEAYGLPLLGAAAKPANGDLSTLFG